ncbi:MAG TPA: twin-arginine translocase subunit TatC [Armatimonadetes bacterium]|nr:twin-arginine translocase subunit TatC [Armatimonadota bacterium]
MSERPARPLGSRDMTFIEHLDELRGCLLRSLAYVGLGAVVAWHFRTDLLAWLSYPALEGARRAGLEDFTFHIFEPAGGIMLMVQIAALGGAVLASGGLAAEAWRFFSPGLYPHERRYVYIVVPSAVVLFLAGVWFFYLVSPQAFGFLMSFNTQMGAQPELTLVSYLRFYMRLLVVFGLTFEMPLVLMFLGRIGVVSARQLLHTWRYAVVLIMIVAAVVTPTPDPFNMALLAGPMIVLYFLSVGLTFLAELPGRRKSVAAAAGTPEPPRSLTSGPEEPMDVGGQSDVTAEDDAGGEGDNGPPGAS